jgi:hypothetical protein
MIFSLWFFGYFFTLGFSRRDEVSGSAQHFILIFIWPIYLGSLMRDAIEGDDEE